MKRKGPGRRTREKTQKIVDIVIFLHLSIYLMSTTNITSNNREQNNNNKPFNEYKVNH
jgi:hypothetical protein